MGSDGRWWVAMQQSKHFNPRSPHGERLKPPAYYDTPEKISIHAPRMGSDATKPVALLCALNFNPRSPHGERRARQASAGSRPISIHAPRMGSDLVVIVTFFLPWRFQSTLPAWGATSPPRQSSRRWCNFNPRSPHGERLKHLRHERGLTQFQSTLPAWGATEYVRQPNREDFYFNPRSPHGERQRKVTILSIRIIDFAQKVYHKTVLLRISLAENAVILPEKPRNPVRTSLQKAGGLRFARAIRAARPYSISSPSGA